MNETHDSKTDSKTEVKDDSKATSDGNIASAAMSAAVNVASNIADKFHLEQLNQARDIIAKNNAQAWYKRELATPIAKKELPIGAKIFGVLCICATLFGIYEVITIGMDAVNAFSDDGLYKYGISTIVVYAVYLIDLLLLNIGICAFGIMLFRGKRIFAALLIYVFYVFLLTAAVCALMLFGLRWSVFAYLAIFAVLVAAQAYLDPYLREERQLQRLLRDNELKHEAEDGTIGRDTSGKGYIDLNFFNLFWIFVACSIIGDAMESVFHVVVVDPGHWQDRAGLLYGPFSPIYGFGAVLMTLALNRFYKKNVVIIFLVSAVIGGAFEYFVSWWMQITYGAVPSVFVQQSLEAMSHMLVFKSADCAKDGFLHRYAALRPGLLLAAFHASLLLRGF